jgi:hypothetical protein
MSQGKDGMSQENDFRNGKSDFMSLWNGFMSQ